MSVMPWHPLHYAKDPRDWHGITYPGAHRHFKAVVYPHIHGWTRDGGVDLFIKTWFDEHGNHERNPSGRPGGWWERYNIPGLKARFAFQDMALAYGGRYMDEGWFDSTTTKTT